MGIWQNIFVCVSKYIDEPGVQCWFTPHEIDDWSIFNFREKILEEIRKSEALTAIRNEISETEIQIDNTNAQSFSNNNEEKITEEINIFEEYEEGFE
mgnify:CR=1 FL=1